MDAEEITRVIDDDFEALDARVRFFSAEPVLSCDQIVFRVVTVVSEIKELVLRARLKAGVADLLAVQDAAGWGAGPSRWARSLCSRGRLSRLMLRSLEVVLLVLAVA